VVWGAPRGGCLFLSGHPLLEYERATIKSIIDPDSLNSTWLDGNSADAVMQIDRANESDLERSLDEDRSTKDVPIEAS
jgi:hypothetical protein